MLTIRTLSIAYGLVVGLATSASGHGGAQDADHLAMFFTSERGPAASPVRVVPAPVGDDLVRVPLPAVPDSFLSQIGVVLGTRAGVVARLRPGELGAYLHRSAQQGPGELVLGLDEGRTTFLPPPALGHARGGGLQGGRPAVPIDLHPTSGGAGTEIQMIVDLAPYVGAYAAEDALVFGRGYGGFLGSVQTLTAHGVLGTVDYVPRFPRPRRVRLELGEGRTLPIPDFQGVSYPDGYVWTRAAGEPSFAGEQFSPDQESLFQVCIEPDYFVEVKPRLEAGKLRFTLPGGGTCAGDRVSFRFLFTRNDGEKVFAKISPSSPLDEHPWSIANLFLLFPLNSLLASTGCVATFEAPNEIVVAFPGGSIVDIHPEGYLRVDFDPATHVLYEQLAGDVDGYDGGNPDGTGAVDQATPSAGWLQFIEDGVGGAQSDKGYDDDGVNEYVAETLDAYGSAAVNGPVRSCKVGTRLLGLDENPATDSIHLGWNGLERANGGATDWGISMNTLDTSFDPDSQWSAGEDVFLCLDASALPVAGGGTKSILDRVAEDRLDLTVQDDTNVDFYVIRVLRCDH